MALMDAYTEFADAYDAGAAGVSNETVNMGNVIDLGSVSRDIARGTPVYVNFSIEETFADTSSGAGLVFAVVSDSGATPAVDGTQTVHVQTQSLGAALADTELTIGKQFCLTLPPNIKTYERYLGVQLVNDASDALTAGKVNAWLSLTPCGDPVNQHYPDAAN